MIISLIFQQDDVIADLRKKKENQKIVTNMRCCIAKVRVKFRLSSPNRLEDMTKKLPMGPRHSHLHPSARARYPPAGVSQSY